MEIVGSTLNERILHLRKAHKLTRKRMAQIVDVSEQAIYNWEVGHNSPRAEYVARYAKHFGVPVDELLKDIEPLPDLAERPALRAFIGSLDTKPTIEEVRWLATLSLTGGVNSYARALEAYRTMRSALGSEESDEATQNALRSALEKGGRPLTRKKG